MNRFTLCTVAAFAVAAISAPVLAAHLNVAVDGAKIEGVAVVFPSILSDKDGYVVIHEMKDGAAMLPASVGHMAIKAGTTENVSVPVMGGAKADTEYMAMIHYETNGNATYDFAEGMMDVDTPGMKPDGTPYSLPFKVAK